MRVTYSVLTGILMMSLAAFEVGFADEKGQPTISMQEATRIVLSQFPNARIREIELDTEDGRLVYEVELTTADGHKKELHVNAMTGQIEKIKHD